MRKTFWGRMAVWMLGTGLVLASVLGVGSRTLLLPVVGVFAMLYAQTQVATGTSRSLMTGCLAQATAFVSLGAAGLATLVGFNAWPFFVVGTIIVAWLSLVTIVDSRKNPVSSVEPGEPDQPVGIGARPPTGPRVQIGRSRKRMPQDDLDR